MAICSTTNPFGEKQKETPKNHNTEPAHEGLQTHYQRSVYAVL